MADRFSAIDIKDAVAALRGEQVPTFTITSCPQCDRLACICAILRDHIDGCSFRRAATCGIGIECDHGRDVCPTCDPCTC